MEIRQHFIPEQQFPICNFFGHWRPRKSLWVVCKGLSALGVCDKTSRSLVSQSLPPSLGLEQITTWTDQPAWSPQSADDVSQQCPVLYITDPGHNLTHFQEIKTFLSRSPRLTYLPDRMPEHPLKGIFRNPGIEGWVEHVHAQVERKAQAEHCHVTKCLFGATRIKKFWPTNLKKIKTAVILHDGPVV